jgi:type IV pilus assembly protein PilB
MGCRNCRNTGYSGRIGVHELLILDDEIRDMVVANASVGEVKAVAARNNMITLRQDGFRKVREGITTIEEVMHVAGDIREASEIGTST